MSDAPTGMLVTATKVSVPFKTELLEAIKAPRFAQRAPHLVGILATKKEDARNYAEVRTRVESWVDYRIYTPWPVWNR